MSHCSGKRVLGDRARDDFGDRLGAHIGDRRGDILGAHDLAALIVNDLALVVHHVVVFQELLADVVVARLDLLLRLGERLVDPGVNDRLALLEAEPRQHQLHPLGAEDPHQIVFERNKEFRGAGVALAAGAAAQLVVDAAALMPLAADHEQPAGLAHDVAGGFDLGADRGGATLALFRVRDQREFGLQAHVEIAAELDVGAAAGHVGGDRHRAGTARLRDDIRLLLVIAGVQHIVLDLVLLEQRRQRLGFLDADRAAQHRLLALAAFDDLLDDRVEFLARRAIDLVIGIGARAPADWSAPR